MLCAAALAPAAALGQAGTYQLDSSGNWVAGPGPQAGTDEAVIAEARAHLADGRASQARALMDDFIEKYQLKDNPWLPEAYLVRGDALTALGKEETALYDYEEIIKSYAGADVFTKAVEREMQIGVRYLNGLKRKFLGMRIVGGERVGEELLIRVQERLPGSRLAESANLELADFYYRTRDLKMAAEAYDVFLINFPNSEFAQKAMQRRTYANVARFKGPKYDAAGLIEAEILVNEFAERFPADAERAGMNDALLARIDDSLALQLLDTAKWYLRRGDEVSARLTLNRLIKRHPLAVASREALTIMKDKGWTPPPAPGPVMDEPPRPTAPSHEPPPVSGPPPAPSPVSPADHPDMRAPGQKPTPGDMPDPVDPQPVPEPGATP